MVGLLSQMDVPTWSSATELAAAVAELHRRPAPVPYRDCLALRERLAVVQRGAGFVLQAGDCAELFCEVSAELTGRKVAQLGELTGILAPLASEAAVAVGRLAGQFAKSRSHRTERADDGSTVPVYLGDAVNDRAATGAGRLPRASRLVTAYEKSTEVLGHLSGTGVYSSHEALLLQYEEPLVRAAGPSGVPYGSSAHLLWIGDRTRHVDGPHVAFARRIANPVAVKLGPATRPDDVVRLVEGVDPSRVPGRLVFIARLGSERVAKLLPPLIDAARRRGADPIWLCDPMHANTMRHAGRKVRLVSQVINETRTFVRTARQCRVHPAGIHLEATPEPVLECVEDARQLTAENDPARYRTACDPRLNPEQARRVVAAFAAAVGQ